MAKKPQKDKKKPKAEELQTRIDELTDALQRERADSDNIRRRHDEQIASLRTVLKAGIIRDLLPAIDNLERALKHVPNDLEGHDYVKGVEAVARQFEKTLKDIGVERIKTVGEAFDPVYHEAVSVEEPSQDSEGMIDVVCEELQPGYRLDGEIIRHAFVKVKSVKQK